MANRATAMAVLAFCSWLGGCAAGSGQQQASSRLMGFPTVTGVGQVRDPQTGLPFFFPCNPCSEPTPKTPLPLAWSQPTIAALPVDLRRVERSVEPMRVEVEPKASVAQESSRFVLFDHGSTALTDRAKQEIQLFALESFAKPRPDSPADRAATKIYPPLGHPQRTVVVTGQVDSTGTVDGNRRIAKLRAEAVKAQLVAVGVPAEKVKVEACVDCFAADNLTVAGRRLNRRATIRFME